MRSLKIQFTTMLLTGIIINFSSCNTPSEDNKTTTGSDSVAINSEDITEQSMPPVQWVLTAEEQAALTPDEVLQVLKEGNERFVSNDLTARDHSAQVRRSTHAQFPKAIVLSCVDSRIPVEDVFDRGIGDVFVARVAGNFVNEDILGSMEFACKVSGAKLIVVMGHENCGAIHAAIDDVKLGNISTMLEKIKPAVAMTTYNGTRTSQNPEFVHLVCESNVRNSLDNILKKSPVLKEMYTKGEINVVGAVYDMDSGEVSFLPSL